MGAFAALGVILASGNHPPFEWLGFSLLVLFCFLIEWLRSGRKAVSGLGKPVHDSLAFRCGKFLKHALRRLS